MIAIGQLDEELAPGFKLPEVRFFEERRSETEGKDYLKITLRIFFFSGACCFHNQTGRACGLY
jgi:hypothetical protein